MKFILLALFLVGCPDTKELPDFHYGNGDDDTSDADIHHDTDVTPDTAPETYPSCEELGAGNYSGCGMYNEAPVDCNDMMGWWTDCTDIVCVSIDPQCDYCSQLFQNLYYCPLVLPELDPGASYDPLDMLRVEFPECAEWEIPENWVYPSVR